MLKSYLMLSLPKAAADYLGQDRLDGVFQGKGELNIKPDLTRRSLLPCETPCEWETYFTSPKARPV